MIFSNWCSDVEPNPKQEKLANLPIGNVLVIAPAGCGKTEALAGRAQAVVARGDVTAPRKILALTFSRKAKENLAERVRRVVGMTAPSSAPRPSRWTPTLPSSHQTSSIELANLLARTKWCNDHLRPGGQLHRYELSGFVVWVLPECSRGRNDAGHLTRFYARVGCVTCVAMKRVVVRVENLCGEPLCFERTGAAARGRLRREIGQIHCQ